MTQPKLLSLAELQQLKPGQLVVVVENGRGQPGVFRLTPIGAGMTLQDLWIHSGKRDGKRQRIFEPPGLEEKCIEHDVVFLELLITKTDVVWMKVLSPEYGHVLLSSQAHHTSIRLSLPHDD